MRALLESLTYHYFYEIFTLIGFYALFNDIGMEEKYFLFLVDFLKVLFKLFLNFSNLIDP
jgi:hypothetical protein